MASRSIPARATGLRRKRLVDRSDGQALLDYVTGARGTICNEGQADRNGDGLVTTYDVYLFLKGLDSGEIAPQSAETEEQSNTVTLQPGASSQIHVKLSLEPEQKIYLDRNYPAGAYCAGQLLLDSKDPYKVLGRLDKPFFMPEAPFEKSGQYKDGTVFIEGLAYYKKKLYLYYGCADSKVAVAICDDIKGLLKVK